MSNWRWATCHESTIGTAFSVVMRPSGRRTADGDTDAGPDGVSGRHARVRFQAARVYSAPRRSPRSLPSYRASPRRSRPRCAPGPTCAPATGPTSPTSTRSRDSDSRSASSSANPSASGATGVEHDRPLDGPLGHQVEHACPRARGGPRAVDGLDRAVLDRDDRLHREHRPDGGLGGADAAAALQVFERVERDVEARPVAEVRQARRRSRSMSASPFDAISAAARTSSPSWWLVVWLSKRRMSASGNAAPAAVA